MLQLLKVTGESLSPFFQTGDYVLVVKRPLLMHLRVGDVVVFRHIIYGTLIKRLERLSPDGRELFLMGTHPDSIDSRQFGMVKWEDVVGKVIWTIKREAQYMDGQGA